MRSPILFLFLETHGTRIILFSNENLFIVTSVNEFPKSHSILIRCHIRSEGELQSSKLSDFCKNKNYFPANEKLFSVFSFVESKLMHNLNLF